MKCENCGKELAHIAYNRRFCGRGCQARAWYVRRFGEPAARAARQFSRALLREREREAFLASQPLADCRHCRRPFQKSRADELYCAEACQRAAWYARRRAAG